MSVQIYTKKPRPCRLPFAKTGMPHAPGTVVFWVKSYSCDVTKCNI